MTVYYVATLARYVLIEAADASTARELGAEQLAAMATTVVTPAEVRIQTVREATADEIEFNHWHNSQNQ